MRELVEQLVSVVADEAEHCERLLMLLRHQQRHLIEGNTEELQGNVREQEDAVRFSRELEQRRQSLLSRLAESDLFGGEKPNLARLIATVSDDYARQLNQLRTSMSRSIQNVIKTKEQNRMLIERSLSNIDETIRLLASSNVAPADYASNGAGRSLSAGPLSVDHVG